MLGILRSADIGIISSFFAGLAVAILGWGVMRVVAVVDPSDMERAGVTTAVTNETFWLLLIVPLSAAKGGLIFVYLRRWLPDSTVIGGLVFGVLVLLIVGVPLMFLNEAYSYGLAILTLPTFGALFVAYGFAVSAIAGGPKRLWTNGGRGQIVTVVASMPAALVGIVSFPIVVPFFH